MTNEMPPEWAIDRALARFPNPNFVNGESWKSAIMDGRDVLYANSVRFLASRIAEYEAPPEPFRTIDRIMDMVRDMEDEGKIKAELIALTAFRAASGGEA